MKLLRGALASNRAVTVLLLLIVAALIGVPLLVSAGSDFKGTDNIAREGIADIDPQAQPWFASLWTPPSAQVEGLLFALQAAIGAGVVGYCLGLRRGQRRK